jgi:cell division protein ZapA
MEDREEKQILVTIAGRPYPLKIKANDETAIRQIVKEVNDKVNRFQLTYPNREKQDCLAMALLTYAVDLHKTSSLPAQPSSTELSDRVSRLQPFSDEAGQ